ncbi:hypothetical protein OS493_022637 [Desmophyllum pertusum]|uniref:G-protein coupled receptors family 1 profile domain-containing protein n=1 Tax=Desmophyllum pertusum TaxID=174260 RepID=A0A9X0CJA2_9CNID|nr:hypothetical protein OS493_022637 [Desmophyllum pertusum]
MASSGDESSESDYMKAVQFTLFIILLLAAVVGNGLLFFLYVRNKTLRTMHNALFADLSTVDFLNSVINIPLSICCVVLDNVSFRGKTFAWTVSFLHTFFALLSLSAITLQMIDRYLAISWPVFYKANKSLTKIMAVIFVKWLAILVIALSIYVPLYDTDIGHAPVLDYRAVYTRKSGQRIPKYIVPVFVLTILLFGGLSLRNLKKRPAHVANATQNVHNSPNARARKKAVYTILILLSISLVCYLPVVIKGVIWLGLKNQARQRLVFVIMFMLSISSAVNPYIALIRVKRYEDKLKVLTNSIKAICCNTSQADVENNAGTAPQNDEEIGGNNTVRDNSFRALPGENRIKLSVIRCDDSSVISRARSCPDIATTKRT